MAAIKVYVHHRETPAPEGLCPKCFNPALKTYTLQTIDFDGVTPVGTRVACTDCRIWIEPLKETA